MTWVYSFVTFISWKLISIQVKDAKIHAICQVLYRWVSEHFGSWIHSSTSSAEMSLSICSSACSLWVQFQLLELSKFVGFRFHVWRWRWFQIVKFILISMWSQQILNAKSHLQKLEHMGLVSCSFPKHINECYAICECANKEIHRKKIKKNNIAQYPDNSLTVKQIEPWTILI